MTLRKPAGLIPGSVSGRSLSMSQWYPMTGQRSLAISLGRIATFLLITLATASLASAQATPPASRPANIPVFTQVPTQVTNQGLPPVMAPQRRPSQLSQPARPTDFPKQVAKDLVKKTVPRADSTPVPVVPSPEPTAAATPESAPVVPSPEPATATRPQSANEPLPFMADTETESREQPPSAGGLLLRTLGALLLIVGLIVAAAWGIKRFGGARFGAPKENAPRLAILNTLSLGERRSLTVVRFGNRTLLLGSTAQSVTLLADDENEDFDPHPRSVADILNDEEPAAFSQELFSATKHLHEQIATRHLPHFTR